MAAAAPPRVPPEDAEVERLAAYLNLAKAIQLQGQIQGSQPLVSSTSSSSWWQGILQVSTLLAVAAILWQGGAKLGRIETQLEQQAKQIDQLTAKSDKQADELRGFQQSFQQLSREIESLVRDSGPRRR